MDDGDCIFYCCGKCQGLFEDVQTLKEHKKRKCDGKTTSSECQLFACERKQHQVCEPDKSADQAKVIPVKAGRKRINLSLDEEDEIPSQKKRKETPQKKVVKKKISVQDVTAGFEGYVESPTCGRRSSGRLRNMPSKYKDFAHQLKIKEEPDDDGSGDVGMDKTANGAIEDKTDKTRHEKFLSDDTVEKHAHNEASEKALDILEEITVKSVRNPSKVKNGEVDPDESERDSQRNASPLDSSQETGQLEQSSFEEITDASPRKGFGLDNAAEIEVGVNRSEIRMETRTRRIKVENVKNEPEDLIREILDGEVVVKRSNVFTKEQKDVLAEKYKEHYKLSETKVKKEDDQNDAEEQDGDGENSPDKEAQSGDKNDEQRDDEDGKNEDDSTEKENKKSQLRRKSEKKKLAKKNKTKSGADGEIKPRWLYHCPICTYKTKHVGFFENHMTRAHDNGKLWTCDQCSYTHSSKGVMRLHRNAHIKPFMCEYCSHKFSTGIDLKKHRYTHTGETPYKCIECDWAGRQKKALIEHMRKHTGEKLKCTAEGCGFETTYRWALEQHRRSKHEKGHRFHCTECTYATSDSGSFSKHKKYHQGVKDYKCGQCSYKAVTKNDVIKHMRIHTHEKIYFCDRCQYSSSHSSAFKAHMMSHLGLKAWKCNVCGFAATTRAKVIRHLESRHQTQDKTLAVNLPHKLQINFDDFRATPEARAQASFVYEVIEAMEGVADETGAIVMEGGEEGEMSVVTQVDPEEFQGLADLAAVSEAAAAQEQQQQQQTVTQIIVQTVDADGNPTEEAQHIELTSGGAGLDGGGGDGEVVSLPGGVMHLPPEVLGLQPGQMVTTTAEDGTGVTYVQGGWETGAETTVVQQDRVEGVVEAEEESVVQYIIEEPVAQMSS